MMPDARRDPATLGRVVATLDVLVGKPRIDGTRISVELIVEELAGGLTPLELLDQYPHLTLQDVQAALAYTL